jgi:tRNA 2-thiouridine synthesizing protein E
MNATVTSDPITRRLDHLSERLEWLVERQARQEELYAELSPILREVMSTATSQLDALEKRGWFDFARELGRVAEQILDHYRPEDVRAFGQAAVAILDTVRAMTQPEVLAIVGEAAQGLGKADEVEPIGLFGMVRAARHGDVQRGMAVLLDVLRHVGRAAEVMRDKRSPVDDRKARLAAALGPRKKRAALGIERPAPRELPAPACHVPAPAPATTMIDGIAFTADGHLADPSVWTRALAEDIAAAQGLTLTGRHWSLIEVAREDFEKSKVAPNIRRLGQLSGMSTREIYTLFPKAPGRTIARIAGTPKPAGCI